MNFNQAREAVKTMNGQMSTGFVPRNYSHRSMITAGNVAINHGKYGQWRYSQDGSRTGSDGSADCSGLVTRILRDNGHKSMPLLTTHAMYYNHQKHFDKVDTGQAREGDIVVWRYMKNGVEKGHTGIVLNLNKQSKEMTYYGSQWGTGPSVTTNTKGILKNKDFIILRPKK